MFYTSKLTKVLSLMNFTYYENCLPNCFFFQFKRINLCLFVADDKYQIITSELWVFCLNFKVNTWTIRERTNLLNCRSINWRSHLSFIEFVVVVVFCVSQQIVKFMLIKNWIQSYWMILIGTGFLVYFFYYQTEVSDVCWSLEKICISLLLKVIV